MQLLIKIIKFVLLLVMVLVLIGIGFTSIYGERIEQIILSTIREKSLSEIVVKDVNFSVFENFPYASVKLTDVLILEKEPNKQDTLLYVNQGYLQFNIFNLISKSREISKIVLLDSKLNIKYDMQGNPNFKIFKQSKDKANKIKLNQIYFSKSAISYLHQATSVEIKGETHKVLLQFDSEKQTDFLVQGDLFTQNLLIGEIDYIQEKEIKVDANFSISEGVFYIQKSDIFIEDVNFYLDGNIENKDVNLNVVGKNQQVKSVLLHMPEKFKSIYKGFVLDGNLSCNGTIKGTISKTSNPHFDMDFNLTNGDFNLKESSFHLSALQLNGNIDNGSSNNFENTLIKAEKCFAKTGNGTLSGTFQVQNLNNYYLSGDINSSLDLAEVNHLFKGTPFFNMKGMLVGNTKYNGPLVFSKKMKDYFLDGKHQSDLQLKDVEFQYKKSPLLFGSSHLKGQIENDKINVESSNITIADSDFKFEGSITQFIPYLLGASTKIAVEGKIESVYVKFDELMAIKDMNASDGELAPVSTMPNWIEADLNTEIEQLSYKYFTAENINIGIDYRNRTLKAKEVKMNTLNGEVTGEVKFYEHPNNYLKLFTSAHLEKINIRDLFTGFQNFGQEFIQDRHIKGVGTSDIQLQSSWNPGPEFDPNKLKLNAHLIIEKGELLEFLPLLNLSSYVSVDELKNVKFSTLENTIKIENNNINIPAMEIKSSALSMDISGTHSFDNEIDYQIRLLLSELISKKARSKNKNLNNEFGVVEDDGLGRTALYLRMDGLADNPNIYFDRIRIKDKIKKEVKKETEEIKKIIKEDILNQKRESSKTEEEKEGDIILEWEDE